MMLLEAFGIGFAVTFGVEVALGLCFAIRQVIRGASRR